MSAREKAPFMVSETFLARKNFRFHGKAYKIDDPFKWKTLSCSLRKLRQLFDTGFIKNDTKMSKDVEEADNKGKAAEAKTKADKKAKPKTKVEPESGEAEETEEDDKAST